MEGNPEVTYDESNRHTIIIIRDARQLKRLREKRAEYYMRHSTMPSVASIGYDALAVHGFMAVREVFKRTTLEAVITLAETNNRDTYNHPITIGETAQLFSERTRIDVSDAVSGPTAIPFVYAKHARGRIPDLESPEAKTNPLGAVFVEAYAIVCAYAQGNPNMVEGGTWLPGEPTIPGQSAAKPQ